MAVNPRTPTAAPSERTDRYRRIRPTRRWAALLVGWCALAAACAPGGDGGDPGAAPDDPGDCVVVDMAVSSEKIDLLSDLAAQFNDSDEARVGDRCVFVRPRSVASGGATQRLAEGWDPDVDGPRPVVWSPASSAWGAILNQRLAERGEPPMAPPSRPFMLTPLVIAMPEPMARALGWPDAPIGWADILRLATDPEGWAAFGHPEWGPFRLGKTNPNFSTSGLSALIAQTYAAAGKTDGLTLEDLGRPEVDEFARGVESAVVHYGPTTLTFLNNWYRNDQRGTALTYASAVAVEEVSIIQYNQGNPDGVLQPGEDPRPPRIPLVAVYPAEGTLFSDNPYIILDAPWVDDDQREAARRFEEFVLRPEHQQRVLEFGFRPGNPEVAVGPPLTPANGVDPSQPQTTLEVPEPEVLVALLDAWERQRKPARVLLLVDVSGSMGELGDPATGATKLDLARDAIIAALEEFAPQDSVGLRIFSTDLSATEPTDYLDLVPIGPVGEVSERLRAALRRLVPTAGTPLYTAIGDSYAELAAGYDPASINALVVLTDGVNEDPRNDDLDGLLETLRSGSEGAASRPVRVFPIAYGADADLATLRLIAEATDAVAYDAGDPATIREVFTAVISNF